MLMFIIFYNLVTRKKKRKKGVVFGAPEIDEGIQSKLERILKSVIFFHHFGIYYYELYSLTGKENDW